MSDGMTEAARDAARDIRAAFARPYHWPVYGGVRARYEVAIYASDRYGGSLWVRDRATAETVARRVVAEGYGDEVTIYRDNRALRDWYKVRPAVEPAPAVRE